jgi:hypothetical protein
MPFSAEALIIRHFRPGAKGRNPLKQPPLGRDFLHCAYMKHPGGPSLVYAKHGWHAFGMPRRLPAALSLALPLTLGACGLSITDDSVYTLYRTSPVPVPTPELQRVHVATFDAEGGEQYNRENCDITRQLFQAQPGIVVRYWCEKGSFRQ